MEAFEQFSLKKEQAISSLHQLQDILKELGAMGLETEKDQVKIKSAIDAVQSDVLRIALLGAFSDGKTSVIAAWLGKVMDDMKIDMNESSDRLAIYKPEGLPGKCEIVDTPGLFGEKEITEGSEQVMYEDITKRYISEAHLILYVVDAVNPLKESHSAVVKWILRDMNKLGSVVFVINKMDEVTDLTDPVLFDSQAKIKIENIKGKLQRAASLTTEELASLKIVCIASNPNGRGLPFWFAKPAQYEGRSRINELKIVTTNLLKTTVPSVLQAKTGLDVVHDIVLKKVGVAQSQLVDLVSYSNQNNEEISRIQNDIQRGRTEVKRLTGDLFAELNSLEKQLLQGLRPLGMQDIRAFLEDELGYSQEEVGYKLNLKIKSIVDRYFDQSSAVTNRVADDIGRQLNSSESFMGAMTEKAIQAGAQSLKGLTVSKDAIFAARDMLKNTLGISLKFKPHGAIKLTASVNQWIGPIGAGAQVAMDVWKLYKAKEQEQALQTVKSEISQMIMEPFRDLYSILSDDAKILAYFAPQLQEFEKIVFNLKSEAAELQNKHKKLEHIQKELALLFSTK
jgi:GTPase SAR1 family protein